MPDTCPFDPQAPAIVIDIGNTSTKVATWHDGVVTGPLSVPTGDAPAFVEALRAHAADSGRLGPAAAVVGSVVPEALRRVRQVVEDVLGYAALVVGDSIPRPIDVDVMDEKSIGVDRVCQAAAAYDQLRTACTVVCFGTAVTVDLVDDEGVLVGGAILPGLRMQLRALHEFTAVLPAVEPGFPDLPYGRNTSEAIQTGVCRGLAGAVRNLVEGYSTHLNRWPQVIATGGDAAFMAPHCDFLDKLVADLTLRGVGVAYSKHLAEAGA